MTSYAMHYVDVLERGMTSDIFLTLDIEIFKRREAGVTGG